MPNFATAPDAYWTQSSDIVENPFSTSSLSPPYLGSYGNINKNTFCVVNQGKAARELLEVGAPKASRVSRPNPSCSCLA